MMCLTCAHGQGQGDQRCRFLGDGSTSVETVTWSTETATRDNRSEYILERDACAGTWAAWEGSLTWTQYTGRREQHGQEHETQKTVTDTGGYTELNTWSASRTCWSESKEESAPSKGGRLLVYYDYHVYHST